MNQKTTYDTIIRQRNRHSSKGSFRLFIKEIISISEKEQHERHGTKNNKNEVLSPRSSSVPIIESLYSFRIMGRIINIQPFKLRWPSPTFRAHGSCRGSDDGNHDNEDDNESSKCVLSLDDGTETIDVVISFEQRTNLGNCTVGDCIDCVGKLRILLSNKKCIDDNGDQMTDQDPSLGGQKFHQNHKRNEQHYFIAKSCSRVTDPNLETLRGLELSTSTRAVTSPFYHIQESTDDVIHQSVSREIDENPSDLLLSTPSPLNGGCKENRVHMFGDLVSKLAPFHRLAPQSSPTASPPIPSSSMDMNKTTVNKNAKLTYLQRIENFHLQKKQQQNLMIDQDQIMNYIEYSKPDGLMEDELALLFDCNTTEEIQALKDGLENMRANFDIYITKTGSYLPL